MTSPIDIGQPQALWVITRKRPGCAWIHSYFRIDGPFCYWHPGLADGCRFTYPQCQEHLQRLKTPGDPWYSSGQWVIHAGIIPVQPHEVIGGYLP
jgi:hypothetical protein